MQSPQTDANTILR